MGGDDVDNFHECEPFEQQNLEILFSNDGGNIQLARFFFLFFPLLSHFTNSF